MEYRITNEFPDSKLDRVITMALAPRLWIPPKDYPDEIDWGQKAYDETLSGLKRHMVLFDREEVVGDVVYQRHKQDPHVLEIKRIALQPSARGRYFASVLVQNAEIEGALEFGTTIVRGDSKVDNPIKHFLRKRGYKKVGQTDLYGLGTGEDIIWEKDLTPVLHRIHR